MSAPVGRPRRELTLDRHRLLDELARAMRQREREARALRLELAAEVRQARAEGASFRAIADALDMTVPGVRAFVERAGRAA